MDYKTLSVVLPENANIYSKMDAAAIKAFINSDGQMTEFAFDGSERKVYSGDTVIFDGSGMEEYPGRVEEIENVVEKEPKESSAIGIIGGADGPTSIFVAGGGIKALLPSMIIIAFVFFALGYALGFYRNKNQD